MSFINSGFTAMGRLASIGLLAVAFLFGLVGVVYMSLQGSEVQVPEITGKDFSESERELAQLGLKIKKRADRNSPELVNTVIEQLPKPGETVKTGQMILVVTSKGTAETDEKTPTLKKPVTEEDDTEKIEEMIDDKPKKPKSNSNTTRKKADTTRDVVANTSENANSDTKAAGPANSNKKEPGLNINPTEKLNKGELPPVVIRVPNPITRPLNGEPRKPPPR